MVCLSGRWVACGIGGGIANQTKEGREHELERGRELEKTANQQGAGHIE